MLLLVHLMSNIAVYCYRFIQPPFLGSPFNQKVMVQISQSNEDEQVNDTHINNCFNQTISQFVRCKLSATDVLSTSSIPLNSSPSTSERDSDLLASVCEASRPSLTLIARSGLGIFQRSEYCPPSGKAGSLKRFPTAFPPCTEGVFRMFKLIDIFYILFQTRVKIYLVRSLNWPLLYSSTMTACRLNTSIDALSRSGTARLARVP